MQGERVQIPEHILKLLKAMGKLQPRPLSFNKYKPHQGAKEKARRVKQMEARHD